MRKIEELALALLEWQRAPERQAFTPAGGELYQTQMVRVVLEALRESSARNEIKSWLSYASDVDHAWCAAIDDILNEPEEPEEPAKPPRCEPPEGEREERSYHWLSAADGATIIGRWTGGVWQCVGDGGSHSPEELHGYSWRWHSRILAPGQKEAPKLSEFHEEQRAMRSSCHCPASVGEPCPLTPEECSARIRASAQEPTQMPWDNAAHRLAERALTAAQSVQSATAPAKRPWVRRPVWAR